MFLNIMISYHFDLASGIILINYNDFYKTDLGSDFIELPFDQKKNEKQNVTKQIQFIKKDLFKYPYFKNQISNLNDISFDLYRQMTGKIPVYNSKGCRIRYEQETVEHYDNLSVKLCDYIFYYFLNEKFSISIIDKMICMLKIKNSLDLLLLYCLVTAFFQFILYHQNKNQIVRYF